MICISLALLDDSQVSREHGAKTQFDRLIIAHTTPVVASAILHADPMVIAEAVAAHALEPRFREGRSRSCYEDHTERSAGYDSHLERCREDVLVEFGVDSANFEDGGVCYIDPV